MPVGWVVAGGNGAAWTKLAHSASEPAQVVMIIRISAKLLEVVRRDTLQSARAAWDRLDDKRASRVRFILRLGGLLDEAKWGDIQKGMISGMDRLAKAVRPYLASSTTPQVSVGTPLGEPAS